MQTNTFRGTVQLDGVGIVDVTVQAANWAIARAMLEAQYGKGRVLGVGEVREEIPSPVVRELAVAQRSERWSFGETLAFALGIAAFFLLNALGVEWKWAVGIAAAVWLGPSLVQGFRSN